MAVFRNVLFLAVAAGIISGVVMTALQAVFTVPLILQAETYEGAAPAHNHYAAVTDESSAAQAAHEHDEDAWAPADGTERALFNVLANLVTGIGFALVLIAGSEAVGGISGWRPGLVWGLAGFGIFTLAPGLGLPPELPAMPAADLVSRQFWWIGTAVATAAGLGLIAFRREAWLSVLGLALIVAPHLIGAPRPASYETPVPESLHHSFVVAVTMTNLVFWVVLGAAVAMLRGRFMPSPAAQPRLA